jgi:hypothetical protein
MIRSTIRRVNDVSEETVAVTSAAADHPTSDLEQPWHLPRKRSPTCVYGTAEIVDRPNRFGTGTAQILKITPEVSWSINLGGEWHRDGGGITPRKTVHQPGANAGGT